MKVKIIGAGLAGCEAAWYLAKKGYEVELYDMKPIKRSPAHSTDNFAELVCSNSLKNDSLTNACGLLKLEMEKLGSIVMESAKLSRVEAGSCLAVDRTLFSEYITKKIKSLPNVKFISEEVKEIDPNIPTIIATGPLTSDPLCDAIKNFFGMDDFYFFDAQAPIIYADSVDYDKVYLKSRYDKGEAAYYNCPFTKEEFEIFYHELVNAEAHDFKDFEINVFEGCMPIEIMAKRGEKTLTFGPLKPVGLRKPNGESPYAVVQLRFDDASKTMFNLVGFQTHLDFPEQKRVFRLIPGLEKARFVKYGRMHKNTFINAPKILKPTYQCKDYDNIFIAGQLSGVEGYIESASSGIYAAINMDRYLQGKDPLILSRKTIMGSLSLYITDPNIKEFQPMNANFGILEDLDVAHKKVDRKELYSKRAIEAFDEEIKCL
ncbi:MAG: methylenetetrahydrofolate--tRNA-(uracil(54)-C(5))-methyltransferase (FADH(2)-oxidizing) TrmFO [Acholeplasmatales bacterium]|nr:methylenetetrahydrofolate--tRNA-(uracil(54)-C(5))-methyltransferase (FADH(2)-oxidizing) TrmFO [Acholeplasmatales bacterium]